MSSRSTAQLLVRASAWGLLLAIAVMTLGPPVVRPELSSSPDLDRALAWALLGALFVIAYPGRIIVFVAFLILAATVLELLQLEALGRHGRASDLAYKTVGVLFGAAIAWVCVRHKRWSDEH